MLSSNNFALLSASDQVSLLLAGMLVEDISVSDGCVAALDTYITTQESPVNVIQATKALATISGSLLEPFELQEASLQAAAYFLSISLSGNPANPPYARVVSEDTLGLSGGALFTTALKSQFQSRGSIPGNKKLPRGSYFAPRYLKHIKRTLQASQNPLSVTIDQAPKFGLVIKVEMMDPSIYGWNLTRELQLELSTSTIAATRSLVDIGLEVRYHSGTSFLLVPNSTEAILRLSAHMTEQSAVKLIHDKSSAVEIGFNLAQPKDLPKSLKVAITDYGCSFSEFLRTDIEQKPVVDPFLIMKLQNVLTAVIA
ncbi:MAG: hypothetical protein HOI11_21510 [Gammaproteobacteria bacterium]|nr:hypothetical protein [Gammaproteobacteria bacterium]